VCPKPRPRPRPAAQRPANQLAPAMPSQFATLPSTPSRPAFNSSLPPAAAQSPQHLSTPHTPQACKRTGTLLASCSPSKRRALSPPVRSGSRFGESNTLTLASSPVNDLLQTPHRVAGATYRPLIFRSLPAPHRTCTTALHPRHLSPTPQLPCLCRVKSRQCHVSVMPRQRHATSTSCQCHAPCTPVLS
jgi:hypothetical protein